jgi:hypothetical protein
MNSRRSVRLAFICACIVGLVSAIWIPFFRLLLHGTLSNAILVYLLIWPFLLITFVGTVQYISAPGTRKSTSQKILFFSGFPVLGIVLWLGVVAGHLVLAGAIWYVGLVTLSAYFFLWPRTRPGDTREP